VEQNELENLMVSVIVNSKEKILVIQMLN